MRWCVVLCLATLTPAVAPEAKGNESGLRAYIIALGNASELQASIQRSLRLRAVVWPAVNGSNALRQAQENVTLYARHTLLHGRHDHMQLGSAGALGCLLSHMEIWRHMLTVPEEDPVAIFEEDAWPLPEGHLVVEGTLEDAARWASNWSAIKLTREAGHSMVQQGAWVHHTPRLASCATKGGCLTFGTRGYLLTREGAATLLRHTRLLDVQVDALLCLADAYDPAFRMLWSTQSTCVEPAWLQRGSSTWDGCLKCFIPPLAPYYLLAALLLLVGTRCTRRWCQQQPRHESPADLVKL